VPGGVLGRQSLKANSWAPVQAKTFRFLMLYMVSSSL
jgi:hypothetical protein